MFVSANVPGDTMAVDDLFSRWQFVEAVAGAGKTTVLVNRFCSIVDQGVGVAITYTNKSTYEMKRRIQEQLGRPAPVLVMTVHQFCAMILRLYPFNSTWPIAFSVLDGVAANNLRRQAVAAVMRERYRRADADWLFALTLGSEYQLEAILLQLVAETKPLVGLKRSIPELYRVAKAARLAYTNLKAGQGVLDFDDLMQQARRVVRKVGGGCVQHVLLDEAQDTNGDQWDLIQSCGVLDPGVSRETSLFIVGDAAQSIYSFQGAEPGVFYAMATAIQSIPGGKVTQSTHNYRCSDSVVEFVNNVFDGWMPEFQYLVPTTGKKGSVQCCFMPMTFDGRMDAIAAYCHAYIAENPGRSWADIALLCRKKKLFSAYREALTARGVPCSVQDRLGFYQQPEVRFLIHAIHAFSDPYAHEAWVAVLEKLGVSNSELVGLVGGVQLDWPSRLDRLSGDSAAAWQSLMLDSNVDSVQEWLNELVMGLGVWMLFPSPQAGANMRQLVRFAVAALAFPGAALPSIIDSWYDAMRHDSGSEQAMMAVTDGVYIMTMHSAKGLEFECVVLPELDASFNRSKSPVLMGMDGVTVNLPPMADAHDQVYFHNRMAALDEERRLFYVACTRAKRDLYMLGVPADSPKTKHMLHMLQAVLTINDAWVTVGTAGHRYPNGSIAGGMCSPVCESEAPTETLIRGEAPPSRQYVSVSALGDYLVSPDSFVARGCERVKKTATAEGCFAAQFGEVVHAVFAQVLRQPDRSIIQSISDASVAQSWGGLAQKNRARLQGLVERFQSSVSYAWLLAGLVHTEWPFSVWIERVCVSGRLDALMYSDGVWWVVDFKTDRVPEHPLPMDYQRQLAIYVLVMQVMYPHQPCRAGVYWCETGAFVAHDVSRETQRLREQIREFPSWVQSRSRL
ncbi:MAG: UvrD-helicase domain-containing protein [Candidatus Marinamargulisbacteria bacterium]|nr:UvrD-helicase domain-containing protein [Candidatus Marinamargulisbacteria bacterium]